ncbi:MAG TPA: hypothetical protein VH186_24840 [Chloroflexia bacterium]|nr:hypothetical protein [Chloroflexia bacterium]
MSDKSLLAWSTMISWLSTFLSPAYIALGRGVAARQTISTPQGLRPSADLR